MTVEYLEINEISKDSYIVSNRLSNKFVKLGLREVNYLLSLQKQEELKMEELVLEPLTEEQKDFLYQKFSEWGFLSKEAVKQPRDFSNFNLVSFSSTKFMNGILKSMGLFISPWVVGLCFLSILYALYAVIFEHKILLSGLTKLHLGWDLILYMVIINFFIAVVHEMSHAAACYKYSGRAGRMGIKLFYLLPAYFCDVSNIYTTGSRKKSLYVSAAGLISNVILGNLSLLLYILFSHWGRNSIILLWIYFLNFSIVLFNLIPFAKFDGYWILKSVTGVDNLYDKSLIMFYTFLLDFKSFYSAQMKLKHKMLMSLYGMLIFLFHWMLWFYSFYAVWHYSEGWKYEYIRSALLALFAVLCLRNCIKFVLNYYREYKKSVKSSLAKLVPVPSQEQTSDAQKPSAGMGDK
jgi:putative peptide zinc metalloprotease protein